MASLGFNFDSGKHEPAFFGTSGSKLPLGINKVKVVDLKSTNEDGRLTVSANIENQDGKGIIYFNLKGKSEKADKFGQQQFAAFCEVCGVQVANDSRQFIDKEIYVMTVIDDYHTDKGYVKSSVMKTDDAIKKLESGYTPPVAPEVKPVEQKSTSMDDFF